jgi:parallel beta-helix repeat protein
VRIRRIYLYSFEREADAVVQDLVIHGLDRNFVFGNNFGPPSNYALNADDLALFGTISSYWTRFAVTGNPNGDDTPQWPAFKHPTGLGRGTSKHIALDWPVREDERLRETQCDFWEPHFLDSVVGSLPAAHPLSDLCGVAVDRDLTLDHDLTCVGDGLIAGADGIRIDLNGHTISGSRTGAGISVAGRTDVVILGGTIRNFEAGIRLANSTAIAISDTELSDNTEGIDLQAGSHANTIGNNTFWNNSSRGIMLRGGTVSNMVRDNTFIGNRVAILLFGAVDTIVKDNVVSASLLAGIRLNVLATGNIINANRIELNPAGVEFLVTPTGSATGNTIVHNTIEQNACGIKGPAAGNNVNNNVLPANGAESCS